jgi:S1-C subfamily serine protease
VQAVLGRSVAPDANSSLRITYGTVRSFKPGSSDPADRPFTVASQIAAKNTGVSPFNAPAGLLSAIRARRFGRYADPALGGDLPIDFLSDLDISGGNSGSPVINRRGELVGVLFDSAEQGVLSDISYDPATSRSISVDVRYLAWTLDVLAGGGGLLAEMGIAPTHE